MALALTAILLSLAYAGAAATQEGEATLDVEPASQNIAPGSGQFEVRILVGNVTGEQGLGGYTLVMSYDPAVVRALAVSDAGLLARTGSTVICPASATDNEAGRLAHLCLTIQIIPQPGPQIKESEVLARITFEPAGDGTTTFDISESAVLDPNGDELSITTTNGEITVGSGESATATSASGESAATTSAPIQGNEESDDGGNAGLIAGVVAGIVAAALVVLGATVFFMQRRRAR